MERNGASLLAQKQSYFQEIEKRYGEAVSKKLQAAFVEKVDAWFEVHGHMPEPMAVHGEDTILPAGFLYLLLKEEVGQEEAFALMHDVIERWGRGACEEHNQMIREKGAAYFFRNWERVNYDYYDEANGFTSAIHPATDTSVTLEISRCLYADLFTQLGCPELTKVFCDGDVFEFGELEGIDFIRQGTIGYGAPLCDFLLQTRE